MALGNALKRWLWPLLDGAAAHREISAAFRGIVATLSVAIFLYFFLQHRPRTFEDGLYDLLAFGVVAALACLTQWRHSRLCAMALVLLFLLDAVVHISSDGKALTFALDLVLLYFAVRALRGTTLAQTPSSPAVS